MIKYIAAILIAFQIAVSCTNLKQNNPTANDTNKTGSNGDGNSFSQAVDKTKIEDSHKDSNKNDNKDNKNDSPNKNDNKDNKDNSPNKNVKTEGNSNAFGTAAKESNQKARSFVVRSK